MYFQTLSAWVLRFRAYDTRYLHFRGMSSWSNCRSLFWNREVTLVKLLIFTKWAFTAIVQIYFQSFSQWFIGFTAYDTCYQQFFLNIKLEQFQITVLNDITFGKRSYFWKKIFAAIILMYFQGSAEFFACFRPLIHDACILIEYQTRTIADHCFEMITWPW